MNELEKFDYNSHINKNNNIDDEFYFLRLLFNDELDYKIPSLDNNMTLLHLLLYKKEYKYLEKFLKLCDKFNKYIPLQQDDF